MSTRPRPVDSPDDEVFWEHVVNGELRVQQCSKCARFRYPPGPSCPRCLSGCAEWVPVSGTGTLLSWVTMHKQYFPTLPVPYIVGMVELEEGVIMCGNLDYDSRAQLRAGRAVEAVLEPCRLEDGTPFMCPQWRLRRSVG
jgi:uncharacterized OB-fold protein